MWFKNLPGRIVAPNITPDPETGAGNWTDDQLARSIREGIGHDGRALFPMMPYEEFESSVGRRPGLDRRLYAFDCAGAA